LTRPYNPGVVAETETSELHRMSLDEYHRLIEAGGFDEDARIELIDGLLLDMSPKTAEHENVIAWLNQRLMLAVDLERYQVRVASAMTIDPSEPEPDVIVIERDAPRPYHPGSAPLVIEVAVSSQRRDLRVKPRIYAGAGVPLYWVIDLDGRQVVVHSDPGPVGYGSVEVLGPEGALTAPQIGIEPIALADVLGAGGL
jgi:Uma2 family endonuclease